MRGALDAALHDLQGHVMSVLYNARYLVESGLEAGLDGDALEAARDVLGAAEEMKALLVQVKELATAEPAVGTE